jgi:hypothetical protein
MKPSPLPTRASQAILIVSTLVLCWLGLQAVHEAGHVVAAWATGAVVERVVLHPLEISRTDISNNRLPLIVVWCGPIFGAIAPLVLWAVARLAKWRAAFLCRFFAGFCLLANGLYIGLGSFAAVGDCGDMLRHGSPRWTLWLFGLLTAPAGLWLWHGQGKHFGLGSSGEPVTARLAYGTSLAAIALVLLEVWLSPNIL